MSNINNIAITTDGLLDPMETARGLVSARLVNPGDKVVVNGTEVNVEDYHGLDGTLAGHPDYAVIFIKQVVKR
jgi:hypothetical protein